MATIPAISQTPTGGIIVDPAHDVFRIRQSPLDPVFRPKVVAVIGASDRPGSADQEWGRTL